MKSYTDTDQSIALSKILPLDSADMNYCNMCLKGVMYADSFKAGLSSYKDATKMNQENIDFFLNGTNYTGIIAWEVLPCWSLAALRNLLPPAIKPNKDSCLFLFESHNTFDKSWVYRYYNEDDNSYLYYKNTNEVDACVEMIIRLNELNLL